MEEIGNNNAWTPVVKQRQGKAPRCPQGITNLQEVISRAGAERGRIGALTKQARNCKDPKSLRIYLIKMRLDEDKVASALRFATIGHDCTNVRKTNKEVDLDSPSWKTPPGGREQLKQTYEAHTIDVKPYIENRWSEDLINHMSDFGVTVIYGDPTTAEDYMSGRDYAKCKTFKCRSSAAFSLWHPPGKPENATIVVTGINVRDKYLDLCLRISHLGMNAPLTVTSVSTPSRRIDSSMKTFAKRLKRRAFRGETICFIGAATRVMTTLGEHLKIQGTSKGDHGKRLEAMRSAGLTDIRDGLVQGKFCPVTVDGKPGTVLGLWVLNGELTYSLVSTLLKGGVRTIVWCGAGGSFRKKDRVGAYRMIYRAKLHGGDEWEIPNECLLRPALKEKWIYAHPKNAHITVRTPLTETKEFVSEAWKDDLRSVDVELAHLFRAVAESELENLHILPGLFLSDVPTAGMSLDAKISDTGAYRNLPTLIRALLEQLHVAPALRDNRGARKSLF
jgi:hypothetical protein